MKYFIDEYTNTLVDPDYITVLSDQDCLALENILFKSDDAVTSALRTYASRSLKAKVRDLNTVHENNQNKAWLRNLKQLQIEQKKKLCSGIRKDLSEIHKKFQEEFHKIIQSNGINVEVAIIELLKEMDKDENKPLYSQSFIYDHIYWKILSNEKTISEFSSEKLQRQLGGVRGRILDKFIKNFDKKYELLHLSPSQSLEQLQLASIICHVSVAIISRLLKRKTQHIFSFIIGEQLIRRTSRANS